ncbi:MAG: ADP-ribose diphosphatase [Alphaproteobacteria bacterium]|nr:ADP-ribose diphosphatase [Alphaproteobacteria bacterium]
MSDKTLTAAPFTAADVEIIERKTLFQAYFRIDRYRVRHRLFAGGWSGEVMREVFERGHAAAVLPYDPGRDLVLLVEQFRVGALSAGRRPWVIEVPAGIIEENETAEEVVRREVVEEAGVAVGALELMYDFLATPGGSSESCALYCGKADLAAAGGIHGLPEEHEDIRVLVMPSDAAIGLMGEGRVENATAIVALQWLALNRDRLRRAWS